MNCGLCEKAKQEHQELTRRSTDDGEDCYLQVDQRMNNHGPWEPEYDA